MMSTPSATRSRQDWEQLAAATQTEGRALINGKLVAALDGRVFDDISPIHGRVVAQVARCGAADVDAAVTSSRAAFNEGSWRRTDPATRKRVMHRFAQLIREDIDRLAILETLDVGKPIL